MVMNYSIKKVFLCGLGQYYLSVSNSYNWFYLGVLDILLKYRRSIIGPWWASITSAVLIVTLSFLWSKIFNLSIQHYVPYFTIGYIIWLFFSSMVLESCTILIENSSIIKQTNIPIPSYIIRNLSKNSILLLHNSVVLIIVCFLYLDIELKNVILSIGGLLALLLITFNISIIVAIISSRYNDFSQLIINLIQVTFFLTPIIWEPSFLKDKIWVTDLNPLFHWIEIIRGPLLQNPYSYNSLLITLFSLLFFSILSCLSIGLTYKKISRWI